VGRLGVVDIFRIVAVVWRFIGKFGQYKGEEDGKECWRISKMRILGMKLGWYFASRFRPENLFSCGYLTLLPT
jgi:hypothetical protein